MRDLKKDKDTCAKCPKCGVYMKKTTLVLKDLDKTKIDAWFCPRCNEKPISSLCVQ